MPENKEPPVRGVEAFLPGVYPFLREVSEMKIKGKIARNREEREKTDVPFSCLMRE